MWKGALSAIALVLAAAPAAADPVSLYDIWINCVQQAFALQHKSTADPAESAERAFVACQTEEQFMKTQALARTPEATANDADQLILELKLDTKQRLVQSAPAVKANPEADRQKCVALLGVIQRGGTLAPLALDMFRGKCER